MSQLNEFAPRLGCVPFFAPRVGRASAAPNINKCSLKCWHIHRLVFQVSSSVKLQSSLPPLPLYDQPPCNLDCSPTPNLPRSPSVNGEHKQPGLHKALPHSKGPFPNLSQENFTCFLIKLVCWRVCKLLLFVFVKITVLVSVQKAPAFPSLRDSHLMDSAQENCDLYVTPPYLFSIKFCM